jgi:signal transduction histidine kinase
VRRRDLVIDAGIAVLALGLSLAMLATGGFGTSAGTRPLDGPGVLLTALSTLPLAVRRRVPLTGYTVTAAASLVLLGLGYPLDVPFGPMIAVHDVGRAYGAARPGPRVVSLLAANLFAPSVLAVCALRGIGVTVILPEMLFWATVMAGMWLTGDRSRLRRERVAALEDRVGSERRLAVAEERTRIARELHDSAGHAINVILVEAGAARLLAERDPGRAGQAVRTIEEVARSTIDEIDRLVRALREERDEAPADPAAFEELVDRHRASGLVVDTTMVGDRGLMPRSVAWAAYRILQEALTNATRHGRGGARVALSFQPEAVEIIVTNPIGRAPSERGGHGLVGMRERAALLGGSLDTSASLGTFRVHALLPHEGVR